MAAKRVIITLFAAMGDVGGIDGCKAWPPRPLGRGLREEAWVSPRLRSPLTGPCGPEDTERNVAPHGACFSEA